MCLIGQGLSLWHLCHRSRVKSVASVSNCGLCCHHEQGNLVEMAIDITLPSSLKTLKFAMELNVVCSSVVINICSCDRIREYILLGYVRLFINSSLQGKMGLRLLVLE